MARMKELQPLYDTFRLFQERCLLQDRSLLWPDQPIWSLENLRRWKAQVIDHPNLAGEMNFNQKLEVQLAGAPPLLWGLAADLHYIYYLPSHNITLTTRLRNITWAAQQGGLTPPKTDDPLWSPFTLGFTKTTIKYHFRYAQLHLLVVFALKVKASGDAERILADAAQVQHLLGEILEEIEFKSDRAYDMRHAILYLMFPDQYERIISTGDKEKIAKHYAGLIRSSNETDIDVRLLQIRRALEKTHPEAQKLDFYQHLRSEWRGSEPETTPVLPPGTSIPEPLPAPAADSALRLLKRFKNLILYGPPGTGKTYWAQQIASRLVAPQLHQAQSKAAFQQTIIEELPFYDILALAMASTKPEQKFSVPELVNLELVQARFRQNPVKNPTNQIWGYLQTHTAPESATVRMALRTEPYLFDKAPNSRWFLTDAGSEYVKNTLAERLDLIKRGPPATNKPEDFIRWITFHQTYAYEDFVEGLRPVTDQSGTGVLTFEIKPGIFRTLCARAQDDPANQYVLVIDEINRGNIAKVFGELMTLIEADKRQKLSVELPYSKEIFQVPSNLMIIGTMNTADRSIALLDVALRRRFTFLELLPAPELLNSINISAAEEDPLNIGNCLRKINKRIAELRGPDYQIGHSYFMPIQECKTNNEKLSCLDDIWNYQVVSLLQEYFYSQADLLRQVLPSFFNQDDDQDQTPNGLALLHGEELVVALNKL